MNNQPVSNASMSRQSFEVLAGSPLPKLTTQTSDRKLWLGSGPATLIVWPIVVPALLGWAIGLWLDNYLPTGYSWTISLLVGGLAIGCLHAWTRVTDARIDLRDEQESVFCD
ncbi:MAG: AtpZ/AtpI family protein [Fimbriimonas sp.]|nr:AtpZ/AtpI family protein [Fimbriimonas sp.]